MIRRPVASSLLFHGRPGDPRLGDGVVALGESLKLPEPPTSRAAVVALFGCPDDTGVRRNHGRAGAALGPESIRRHLYKMTPPMDFAWEERLLFVDAGDIVPAGDDIVETHRRAHGLARTLAAAGATVVVLGGGHDFAAPAFLGTLEGAGPKGPAALLNVDPHLDMRPLEHGLPHSGSPFRQLLDSGQLLGSRHCTFGARANRNSRESYDYARKKKTRVVLLETIAGLAASPAEQFRRELSRLEKGSALAGVTVDIDSCRDAEGSSAAPVLGFSAAELCAFAATAGRSRRVRYFEIAEVAPSLDATERSARIAAEAIFAFLAARASSAS